MIHFGQSHNMYFNFDFSIKWWKQTKTESSKNKINKFTGKKYEWSICSQLSAKQIFMKKNKHKRQSKKKNSERSSGRHKFIKIGTGKWFPYSRWKRPHYFTSAFACLLISMRIAFFHSSHSKLNSLYSHTQVWISWLPTNTSILWSSS